MFQNLLLSMYHDFSSPLELLIQSLKYWVFIIILVFFAFLIKYLKNILKSKKKVIILPQLLLKLKMDKFFKPDLCNFHSVFRMKQGFRPSMNYIFSLHTSHTHSPHTHNTPFTHTSHSPHTNSLHTHLAHTPCTHFPQTARRIINIF